jgi:hypothetical protein
MKQHLLHLGTAGFSVILGASHGERDPPCHAAERKHERQRAKSKTTINFFVLLLQNQRQAVRPASLSDH